MKTISPAQPHPWVRRAVTLLICSGLLLAGWTPSRPAQAQIAPGAAQPLTVRYIGMRDGTVGAPFHLAARVRASATAAPAAGVAVVFTLLRADGSVAGQVGATTGADGIAPATIPFSADLAGGTVIADLAGASDGRSRIASTFAPRTTLNAPQMTPATVTATLQVGQGIAVSTQVTLPATPDFPSDVVFAFDANAGMAGFLPGVKGAAEDAMLALTADGLDVRFASVALQDYPGAYSSFGYTLGDAPVVTYGVAGAYPYSLTQALTAATAPVVASFDRIQATDGGDPPASYARALHEAIAELNGGADPTFGPLGYRGDAARLVVVFGETIPHDNDLNAGVPGSTVAFPTGGDPGRNALMDEPHNPVNIGVGNDDLDWQQVLAGMSAAGVRLIAYELNPFYTALWSHWAERTGGQSVAPLDDLAAVIRSGMLDTGPVGTVTLQAQDGFAAWLGVAPAQYTDVSLPAYLPFSMTVTPPAGTAPGIYGFTVNLVGDGEVLATQQVSITVAPPPNQAPVAATDTFTVVQDSAGNALAILANDGDPDGDPLTLTQVDAPTHGVATQAGNTVLYTPAAGYTGPDAFTYTVSDGKDTASATVNLFIAPKPNQTPVAVNDAYTVTQGSVANLLAVLANDSDPDGDPLTLVQVGAASHGAITRVGNTAVYTPTAGYTGPDAFTYTVSDGKDTANATVSINVSPIPNRAPVAGNDTFTVTQDSAGNLLAVLANDSDPDGDPLTLVQVGAASHGVVSRVGNSVFYTPAASYTGPDAFTYTVSDGKAAATATVNLTVSPLPNRTPVAANDAFTVTQDSAGNVLAVLANDSDPDGDPLTLVQVGAASHGVVSRAGSSVLYTPTAGYTGPDSFSYIVTDGKAAATATVNLTVSPLPNRTPVAVNDAFTVTQDSAGNVLAVLANDSDPDGDPLTLVQVGAAGHGVVSRVSSSVLYTPTAGYTGPDAFTYTVSDGKAAANATVNLTVSPLPNRTPVAVNDAFTVTQGSAGNVLAVLANDSDPDGDPLTLVQVGAASHGVASRAGSSVLYTPTAGYTGPDAFTYTVSDGKAAATATVNLTVSPLPNRTPVAVNDAFTVTQGSAGNVLAVLANDSDPDGDPLTLVQVDAASHGVAARVGNSVFYTPTAGYTGPDAFTYTVTDGKTTANATVSINVSPLPNRAPVVVNDAFTVTQDSAGNMLAVLANDSDPDSDPLTLVQVGAASHGVASLSGGRVLYTPTAGYTGPDAFTYTVSDGKATANAMVSINVSPIPNRTPVTANDAFTVTQGSTGNVLAVLANDSDPDGDPLTLVQVGAASHGAITRVGNTAVYTPAAGYTGSDAFTYTVSDGKAAATATVNLSVTLRPAGSYALLVVGERTGAFADGVVTVGQLLTVTTWLTNTGAVTLTAPPLTQEFAADHLARVSEPVSATTRNLATGEAIAYRAVYRALATTRALPGSVTLVRTSVTGMHEQTGAELPGQAAQTPVRITAPGLTVSTQRAAVAGASIAAGDLLTFTITIMNSGDTSLTHLPLREHFPAAMLTFLRASVAGAAVDPDAGVLQWPDLTTTLGDLAPGAAVQFDVTYTLSRIAGDAVRTVTVADARDEFGDPLEPAAATSPVVTPALSLGIMATPAAGSQVKPGSVVTYELQLWNTGDTLLSGSVITGALAGDGAFITADRGASTLEPCPLIEQKTPATQVRAWRIAALEAGASCGVVVTARVAVAPAGGDITLAATVQAVELAEPTGAEVSHVVFPVTPLIASFTALSGTAGIRLDWTTTWETGLDGFHLWRGTTDVRDDATRLTEELLPATGAPADYSYLDQPFVSNTYYYWLEPVGDWGNTYVGPVAMPWAMLHTLLPVIFGPCTEACAPTENLWLPLVARQVE